MQIGVVFPQTEIGADVGAVRAYAQGVEQLGYRHLLAYDHVLGADPQRPPRLERPLRRRHHLPRAVRACSATSPRSPRLELVTGIIILPQRQTALVAKQAAEVDLLTGGRFRLGIGLGWNARRVRGAGQGLHQPGAPGRGAGRAAAAALDRAERHLPRHRRAGHRRRPRPAAGAAPDPDLVRRPVTGGLPADRAPGRRLVPAGPARPAAGRCPRDRRAKRPSPPGAIRAAIGWRAGSAGPGDAGPAGRPRRPLASRPAPATCRSTPWAPGWPPSTRTWPRSSKPPRRSA